jgi:hypothetical protein
MSSRPLQLRKRALKYKKAGYEPAFLNSAFGETEWAIERTGPLRRGLAFFVGGFSRLFGTLWRFVRPIHLNHPGLKMLAVSSRAHKKCMTQFTRAQLICENSCVGIMHALCPG